MDAEEANIYNAIVISCVVIGIIILFFIISVTRQQRKNLALHRLNILAEITALEKERARIAHDLHDELGPLLSAVKMKINSFELTDEDDKVQISKTNRHIDDILKRIREISFDLMPTSLLRKGLGTALKEFVDYMNNDNQISFSFDGEINSSVEDRKAINIYRIVQEVSHNAVKYSGASSFNVEVNIKENKLHLVLSDDGNGFDQQKASKESVGFGLRGIVSRTEMMGGQMYLESKEGKGTIYTFEIPV